MSYIVKLFKPNIILNSITSMFYRTINSFFNYSNNGHNRNKHYTLEQILVY